MRTREKTLEHATALEREAHQLHSEQKTQEAFNLFDEAASLYSQAGEHLKAALCYASAATCWNIRTGWQPLRNAATRNELGAHQALKAGHYGYARSLFREAALLYEKEGDFDNYSKCFWGSQVTEGKRAWALFAHSKKEEAPGQPSSKIRRDERVRAFFYWFLNTFGRITWGYGERPFRTLGVAAVIIVGTAVIYTFAGPRILVDGAARSVSFVEALYLSVITFTTVGFGDYLPLGWTRIVAAHEALAGIFLSPLFLVGLTRRFLRMYR